MNDNKNPAQVADVKEFPEVLDSFLDWFAVMGEKGNSLHSF